MSRFLFPLLLASSLFLEGCSFHPLLSETSSASSEMPFIKINLIKDRPGQKLHNYLIPLIIPKGPSKNPLYELRIALDLKEGGRMYSRDKVAQRKESKTTAKVDLWNLKTNKKIWSQTLTAQNAYSISGNTDIASFSTYIAKQTSQDRTFELLAHDIHTHLAAFLEGQSLQKSKAEDTKAPKSS